MNVTLTPSDTDALLSELLAANAQHSADYPGDSSDRQPVHTVYGGANLFKAGSAAKLGGLALRALSEYAPDYITLAKTLQFPGADTLPTAPSEVADLTAALQGSQSGEDTDLKTVYPAAWLAYTIYERVTHKLKHEAIEDNRIDFEDGYGNRPDEEEDGHAVQAAEQVAQGMSDDSLPPFIGIRIKTLTEECRVRAVRTLDLFLTRLAELTSGKLPANFIITLPKVTHATQVATLAKLLGILEQKCGYASGSLKMEIMIETTQAIINDRGHNPVYELVKAADGRCRSAIFGTYDYTATCNITAAHQTHTHAACDFARHVMQVALAG